MDINAFLTVQVTTLHHVYIIARKTADNTKNKEQTQTSKIQKREKTHCRMRTYKHDNIGCFNNNVRRSLCNMRIWSAIFQVLHFQATRRDLSTCLT